MQLYLIYLCIKYKDGAKNYQIIPNENNNNANSNINMKQELCQVKNLLNFKLFWKWENYCLFFYCYFIKHFSFMF